MKCTLHISLLLVSFFLFNPPSIFHIESFTLSINSDKDALISLQSQLTTDPTNPLSSWDHQSSSPCNWTRVLCNRFRQRVIGLNLSGLGLVGPISPHIGNLSFLQSLQLQNNQLTGPIPTEMCNLHRLKLLNMSYNTLEGPIPSNITMLRELQVMDLTMNKITGSIPGLLGLSPNLRILNLGKNNISGSIPSSLGNISSLTNLNLGTNSLKGPIPEGLRRLTRLKLLDLSINHLTGEIPPFIYNMSSLEYLIVASNNLWGELPYDVGQRLPNLLAFNFCINKFTGRIPGSLHNLTNIQLIRMAHNLLHGSIPPGLGKLTSLTMYNIGYNRIVSSGDNWLDFVTSLGNTTRLNFLSFEGNLIEGIIPDSIGNWSKVLSYLYMGENLFHGDIPKSIGQLSSLALLNMSYNEFTGPIPVEITQLGDLQTLILAKNNLSGTVPKSIGNLQRLNHLDLSSNKLKGAIPKQVLSFPNFNNILDLSNNLFGGQLPEEVRVMENAIAIDTSHNQLSGSIPSSIMNCKSLEVLKLAGNSFSGPIPSSLGNLTTLQTLDLSHNQLSGLIPTNLESLTAIQSLNLSFNNLEGGIPCGGVFKNLSKVELQGNPKLSSLETCQFFAHNQGKRSLKPYVIVIMVIATLSICLAMTSFFYMIIRKRKISHLSKSFDMVRGGHDMVKYDELRKATGDFSQGNLIGRGSFGEVFKGTIGNNIRVAVKVLDMKMGASWKSFIAECEALKNIRHRNLVKLITCCSSLDSKNMEFLALVYEFLSNGNLEDWIKGKRRKENGDGLNFVERLNVVIDVGSGLDYLHHDSEVAVVHCDVKPSNVLLDEDMTAKIGDFGLATLLMDQMGNQTSISSTHVLKGSIGYMPPEYGVGVRASTPGDTYSFGVTLLELFTGKNPSHQHFTGDQNLVSWVQKLFPTHLTQAIDPQLLGHPQRSSQGVISPEKLMQSFIGVFEVGLSCTAFQPHTRLTMRQALHNLTMVRDKLFKS